MSKVLGFRSDQVEEVEVGDEGGVRLVLNDAGEQHLKETAEMMAMEGEL